MKKPAKIHALPDLVTALPTVNAVLDGATVQTDEPTSKERQILEFSVHERIQPAKERRRPLEEVIRGVSNHLMSFKP